MDVYNMNFFHVVQFVLAATPFFAYRNISASEGRKYPYMGFKITKIIELVGTQAIIKLISYYLFELSLKNRLYILRLGRLSQNSISTSEVVDKSRWC